MRTTTPRGNGHSSAPGDKENSTSNVDIDARNDDPELRSIIDAAWVS